MHLWKSITTVLLMLVLALYALPAAAADSDGSRIRAEGTGIAPAGTVSGAQARALARRAAMADAYRQLAEQIRGVEVDAATTVENMMVASDTVRTHVSALIRGARIVEERGLRDYHRVTVTGLNSAVWPDPPGYRAQRPDPETAEKPRRAPRPARRMNRKTEGGTGNAE